MRLADVYVVVFCVVTVVVGTTVYENLYNFESQICPIDFGPDVGRSGGACPGQGNIVTGTFCQKLPAETDCATTDGHFKCSNNHSVILKVVCRDIGTRVSTGCATSTGAVASGAEWTGSGENVTNGNCGDFTRAWCVMGTATYDCTDPGCNGKITAVSCEADTQNAYTDPCPGPSPTQIGLKEGC